MDDIGWLALMIYRYDCQNILQVMFTKYQKSIVIEQLGQLAYLVYC